jgi:hypothetical protein
MRKILVVFALVVMVAILSLSCGSTKTCPAYSSNDIEQTNGDNG